MPIDQRALDQALELFALSPTSTREQIEQKRRELLAIWHPPRYANLTNNPRKYMLMYKKGEAMTKEIEAAYQLLCVWLTAQGR